MSKNTISNNSKYETSQAPKPYVTHQAVPLRTRTTTPCAPAYLRYAIHSRRSRTHARRTQTRRATRDDQRENSQHTRRTKSDFFQKPCFRRPRPPRSAHAGAGARGGRGRSRSCLPHPRVLRLSSSSSSSSLGPRYRHPAISLSIPRPPGIEPRSATPRELKSRPSTSPLYYMHSGYLCWL